MLGRHRDGEDRRRHRGRQDRDRERTRRIRGAGLVNMQVRDLQEALKDLELYCFVTPKGKTYELVPVAFPALLDHMTVKQMEITATVEAIQSKAKKEMFSR